jgi:hypothetical protein
MSALNNQSDLPFNAPATAEEELAQLRRADETLNKVLDECYKAGFDGSTTLVDFIRARLQPQRPPVSVRAALSGTGKILYVEIHIGRDVMEVPFCTSTAELLERARSEFGVALSEQEVGEVITIARTRMLIKAQQLRTELINSQPGTVAVAPNRFFFWLNAQGHVVYEQRESVGQGPFNPASVDDLQGLDMPGYDALTDALNCWLMNPLIEVINVDALHAGEVSK